MTSKKVRFFIMLAFCMHLLLWLFLLLVYLVLVDCFYCLHLLALYVDSYWWLSLLVYGCTVVLMFSYCCFSYWLVAIYIYLYLLVS